MTVLQFRRELETLEELETAVELEARAARKAKAMELPLIVEPPCFVDADLSMPTSHQRCGNGYVIAYFDPSGRFFSTYHTGCGHEFPVQQATQIGFYRQRDVKQGEKQPIGFATPSRDG